MRTPLPKIKIRNVYFKNPFAILAYPSKITFPKGRVDPEILMYYKALAQRNPAMVVTGPATVLPPSSRKYSLLRIDQPKYLEGMKALTKILATNGCIPGVQIVWPGESADPIAVYTNQMAFEGFENVSQEKLVQAYENAASRAIEIGFKYVELCASNNVFLHQLLQRGEYPKIEQIFKALTAFKSEDALIGLKLNGNDPNASGVANLFQELGGDLICFEGDRPNLEFKESTELLVLKNHISVREMKQLMKNKPYFLGLPVVFKHKAQQIQEVDHWV